MKYRVLIGLNYVVDKSVLRRLRAGEAVPFAERKERRAEPGEVVDDLPVGDVEYLLARGAIESADESPGGEG